MNKKIKTLLLLESSNQKLHKNLNEYTLLLIRVLAGLSMLLAHGVGKWNNFSNLAGKFPDPFGFLGSKLSLTLVVGSEVFGALLLIVGLFTRWVSFSLLFTMLVASFVIHWSDPFSKKELAFIYALIYLYFTIAGAGKYSLDSLLKNKWKN